MNAATQPVNASEHLPLDDQRDNYADHGSQSGDDATDQDAPVVVRETDPGVR